MIINSALSVCYLLGEEIRKYTADIKASDAMISANVFVGKLPKKTALIEPEVIDQWEQVGDVQVPVYPPDIQDPDTSDETVYPYILIRPTDMSHDEYEASSLGSTVAITITVASESYEDDGFVDVCYLMDAITQMILEQERFGNAVIQRPLTASYPNFEDFSTQNHYFGDMFLKFEMPTIERKRSAFL